jgi:hypothetical protein
MSTTDLRIPVERQSFNHKSTRAPALTILPKRFAIDDMLQLDRAKLRSDRSAAKQLRPQSKSVFRIWRSAGHGTLSRTRGVERSPRDVAVLPG